MLEAYRVAKCFKELRSGIEPESLLSPSQLYQPQQEDGHDPWIMIIISWDYNGKFWVKRPTCGSFIMGLDQNFETHFNPEPAVL